jgi:hypothetical protein
MKEAMKQGAGPNLPRIHPYRKPPGGKRRGAFPLAARRSPVRSTLVDLTSTGNLTDAKDIIVYGNIIFREASSSDSLSRVTRSLTRFSSSRKAFWKTSFLVASSPWATAGSGMLQ